MAGYTGALWYCVACAAYGRAMSQEGRDGPAGGGIAVKRQPRVAFLCCSSAVPRSNLEQHTVA